MNNSSSINLTSPELSISSENKLPLVSIVLTTFNGERFLKQQLDSILCQTYHNIEIVALDDSSTDNTVEILNEYAARHKNMKVFVNEFNIGFIKNFEKGCTLANGDLISFCDQDDYWYPDKIKKMADAIYNYPIIYCDSIISDENFNTTGAKISDLVNFKSWNNCLQLAIFCRIYAHTMLCKKSFLKNAYPFLEVIPPDWWLPYLSTFYGGMKYLPEPLVLYRQHQNNVAGVIGGKRKRDAHENRRKRNRLEKAKIRTRINAFYNACPGYMTKEKNVLLSLVKSYNNFSLMNNLKRFIIFLRYRNVFLDVKKHSRLHRFLFCFKMFVNIK